MDGAIVRNAVRPHQHLAAAESKCAPTLDLRVNAYGVTKLERVSGPGTEPKLRWGVSVSVWSSHLDSL